jgi:DNA-binding beta-propeller fold protein YncE
MVPSADQQSSSVRTIGNVEGQADNQFSQPRDVCVDHATKTVFVVDNNNHRIQLFNLHSLAFIKTIGLSSSSVHPSNFFGSMGRLLNSPVGCCLDRDGQLFVSDTNNHRIVVFNHVSGELVRTISQQGSLRGFLNSPYGICVDSEQGHLYVADYHNHRIQVFHKDTGDLVHVFGSHEMEERGQQQPQQNQEQEQQQEGEMHPGVGPGQFNEPIAVALDTENNRLLVADFSNNRVQVLNKSTGEFICYIGGGLSNEFRGPRGLAVDRASKLLFVSDRENHRIKVYNKDSYLLLRTIGAHGTDSMQFNRPTELCMCVEEGVLLVVDGYNHRLQVIEIEELQGTKVRIAQRNKARAEEERRLRNLPKASRTAFETELSSARVMPLSTDNNSNSNSNSNSKNKHLLHFPALGPLYDFEVSGDTDLSPVTQGSSSVALASAAALSPDKGATSTSLGNLLLPRALLSPLSPGNTDRHARSFLGVIASIHDDLNDAVERGNEEDSLDALSLLVPPVLALHALVERRWVPHEHSINDEVVHALAKVLQAVRHVTVDEQEKQRVVEAVTSILKLGAMSSPAVADAVFRGMLGNLVSLGKGSYSSDDMLSHSFSSSFSSTTDGGEESGADDTWDGYREAVVASMQLVCDVFLLESASITASEAESLQRTNSGQNNQPSSSSKEYHKEIVQLVFGRAFIPAKNGSSNNLGLDDTTHTNTNADAAATFVGMSDGGHSFSRLPAGLVELIEALFRLRQARSSTDKNSALSSSSSSSLSLDKLSCHALRLSVGYLRESRGSIAGMVDEENAEQLRTRGGRNIWREGELMMVGDLVDAMDKEKCWFESVVVEVRPGMNVKVHFMGWGSKWDDVISMSDLSSRVAPLNTKTKDWRADLFEGGLIEIKCNEDTVYQKWMWGRIIAMNTQEEWVDVSYSFSNEPPVLKRAALFGETICPVGMHTKDRSKAVMATVVRPPKRAEELVQRKKESVDDVAFHDHEDELHVREASSDDEFDDWDDLQQTGDVSRSGFGGNTGSHSVESSPAPSMPSSPYLGRQAGHQQSLPPSPPGHMRSPPGPAVALRRTPGSSGSTMGIMTTPSGGSVIMGASLEHPGSAASATTAAISGPSPLDRIARIVFEGVMAEVVSVVTSTAFSGDYNSNHHNEGDEAGEHDEDRFSLALAVLRELAGGPFRRLLAPYFCRVLIVQCGLRSKLLASGYLRSCPFSASSASDFAAPNAVLQQIRALETVYCQLVVRCLGDHLSMPLVRRVLLKMQATASKCGIAPLASNFTQQLARSSPDGLRQIFIRDVLQNERRFKGDPSALRSILLNLLPIASKSDQGSISAMWAQVLTEWVSDTCCAFAVEHASVVHAPLSCMVHSQQLPRASAQQPGVSSLHVWGALLDQLLDMLERARSVSRLEFNEAERCHLAAEVAFHRAFSALPDDVLVGISKMLAVRLAGLLDESVQGVARSSAKHGTGSNGIGSVYIATRDEPSAQSAITRSIDSLVELVGVAMDGHTSRHLREFHTALLAERLLRGTYSLNQERLVLQALPYMPQALSMLRDMEITGTHSLEFRKFLLARLDDGTACLAPSAVEMVFQSDAKGPSLCIDVLPASTWPLSCSSLSLYCSLKLPVDLAEVAKEFEIYHASVPSTWSDDAINALMDQEQHSDDVRFQDMGVDGNVAGGSGGGVPRIYSPYSVMASPLGSHSRGGRADFSDLGGIGRALHHRERNGSIGSGNSSHAATAKRLFWCHGIGNVTLELTQGSRSCCRVEVNEPMAAVLMLFNAEKSAGAELSAAAIGAGTGLEPQAVTVVLHDLCGHVPALLEQSAQSGGYRVSEESLSLSTSTGGSTAYNSGSYSNSVSRDHVYAARAADMEQEWARHLLDAVLVRVAKAAPRGRRWLGHFTLSEKIRSAMRERRRLASFSGDEISERCERLASIGVLQKRRGSTAGADIEYVEYCYYLHAEEEQEQAAARTERRGWSSTVSTPGQVVHRRSGQPLSARELYRNVARTLKISGLVVSGEDFMTHYMSWLARLPLTGAASKYIRRWASRPDTEARPVLSSHGNTTSQAYPFDAGSSGLAATLGVGIHSSSHGVAFICPGEDASVRSFVIASSLALCVGVSQLAKLEYAYHRAPRAPSVEAVSASVGRNVAETVSQYLAFLDKVTFRALASPSALDVTGLHEVLFDLLPSGLAQRAAALLRSLTVSATGAALKLEPGADTDTWDRRQGISSARVTLLCTRGVLPVSLGAALIRVGSSSRQAGAGARGVNASSSTRRRRGDETDRKTSVAHALEAKDQVLDADEAKSSESDRSGWGNSASRDSVGLPPSDADSQLDSADLTLSLKDIYFSIMGFEVAFASPSPSAPTLPYRNTSRAAAADSASSLDPESKSDSFIERESSNGHLDIAKRANDTASAASRADLVESGDSSVAGAGLSADSDAGIPQRDALSMDFPTFRPDFLSFRWPITSASGSSMGIASEDATGGRIMFDRSVYSEHSTDDAHAEGFLRQLCSDVRARFTDALESVPENASCLEDMLAMVSALDSDAVGDSSQGSEDKEEEEKGSESTTSSGSPSPQALTTGFRRFVNQLAGQVAVLHQASVVYGAFKPGSGQESSESVLSDDERDENKTAEQQTDSGIPGNKGENDTDSRPRALFQANLDKILLSFLRLTHSGSDDVFSMTAFCSGFADTGATDNDSNDHSGGGISSTEVENSTDSLAGAMELASVLGATLLEPAAVAAKADYPGTVDVLPRHLMGTRLFSSGNNAHEQQDCLPDLLSRVYCVAEVTGQSCDQALFWLGLPSVRWDEGDCVHAYVSQKGTATAADAVLCSASLARAHHLPTGSACSALFVPSTTTTTAADASSEGGDVGSTAAKCCFSCCLSSETGLLALTCSHWHCQSCWKTSLLDQAAGAGATMPMLQCPCCAKAVPPALCRQVITDNDTRAIVSEYAVRAALMEFCKHVSVTSRKGLALAVEEGAGRGEGGWVNAEAPAPAAASGAGAGAGAAGSSSPSTRAHLNSPGSSSRRRTAHPYSNPGEAVLGSPHSRADDLRGARWRGLLNLVGATYHHHLPSPPITTTTTTVAVTGNGQNDHLPPPRSPAAPPPIPGGGGHIFGFNSPAALLAAVNADRATFARLHAKFYALKNSAAVFEAAVSTGDWEILKSVRLRSDAWDVLATAYAILMHSCGDATPTMHSQQSSEGVHAAIALAHTQALLLAPLRQYVGALAKTVEATSSQRRLEEGASQALRQLLRVVKQHLYRAEHIILMSSHATAPAVATTTSTTTSPDTTNPYGGRGRAAAAASSGAPHSADALCLPNMEEPFGHSPASIFQ